ncbi:hypothetical protein DMB38_28525 [Streptomyces sp. WAC 06738]|uniref:CU044_2847 family protein n=1 Tax=Streptomyces sp. WAC 06738 TaxID=2203210 RepID=UPI000F7057D5|nr:CU044_2847 family protein [Streptomyces sp. WAC 06738]AZM49207.1 hypothetical protein DMB38_28525 [Streptomyces sp. WAC 06738]
MADFIEFTFADGTAVELQAFAPLRSPQTDQDGGHTPGFGDSRPVSAGRRVSVAAEGALRTLLAPLGPLLQQVHNSVSAVQDVPSEVSVSFGVRVSSDLKLGIVGAGGEATMTVTVQWQPGQGSGTAAGSPEGTAGAGEHEP